MQHGADNQPTGWPVGVPPRFHTSFPHGWMHQMNKQAQGFADSGVLGGSAIFHSMCFTLLQCLFWESGVPVVFNWSRMHFACDSGRGRSSLHLLFQVLFAVGACKIRLRVPLTCNTLQHQHTLWNKQISSNAPRSQNMWSAVRLQLFKTSFISSAPMKLSHPRRIKLHPKMKNSVYYLLTNMHRESQPNISRGWKQNSAQHSPKNKSGRDLFYLFIF